MKELTPQQTDAVRQALADARHTDPIPADVAARLEHALDGLRVEREGAEPRPVVSLDARRRRRYAARMLVAAAAVVVGGFGIDAMVGHGVLQGSSDDSATSGLADRDNSPEAPGPTGTPKGPEQYGSGAVDGVGSGPAYVPAPTSVSGMPLGEAYRELDKQLVNIRRDYALTDTTAVLGFQAAAAKALTVCVTPGPDETPVLVRYAGHRAALLIHGADSTKQVVEIYSCPIGHTGHLLRTVVVPAR